VGFIGSGWLWRLRGLKWGFEVQIEILREANIGLNSKRKGIVGMMRVVTCCF